MLPFIFLVIAKFVNFIVLIVSFCGVFLLSVLILINLVQKYIHHPKEKIFFDFKVYVQQLEKSLKYLLISSLLFILLGFPEVSKPPKLPYQSNIKVKIIFPEKNEVIEY